MRALKILIIDEQKFSVQLLRDILSPQGFIIETASDGQDGCALAFDFQPDLVLLDLTPGMEGVETCRRIKGDDRTSSAMVIVLAGSKEKEQLAALFEAGADDYVTKPVSGRELLIRVNSNLAKREFLALIEQKARDSETLLEISQAVNSPLNTDEILQSVVTKLAHRLDVERCSIIRVDEGEGTGVVLAASDLPGNRGMRIDLVRYPEIREVIRTGRTVVVENVRTNPLMKEVKEYLPQEGFTTVLVVPITFRSEIVGELLLRTTRDGEPFTGRELSFCELAANVVACALQNARLLEKTSLGAAARTGRERDQLDKDVFETIFEHAPEGLMVLNVRGEPLYVNRSALEILGYTRGEALGKTLSDFLAEESYSVAMESHVNFFLGRDFRGTYDLMITTGSGEKRVVSVSVSDHHLLGNYAILSFRDVTEERIYQQQLKATNERLIGLDHLRSEYIDTATHELRTPVTVIHSYCSLLKEMGEENLTDEQREYLNAALEGSRRLTELINDMLDLSRLEAGKEDMQFEDRNIMEPIREVYSVLAPFAYKNGLEISIEPGQEGVSACFDTAHIQCVLTNLVGNAIKFTPRGGKIGISVAREGNDVLVSVTDTGEGIPEDYVSRIFDEFCQVRATTGPKKGTGLGLAICKRIVSAHKGKMWVSSAIHKGSRFTFSLPVSRS